MLSSLTRRLALAVGVALALAGAVVPPAAQADDSTAQVAKMSLEEKVGQMMWTHVYGKSADDASLAAKNQAVFGADVRTPAEAVKKFDLGGVLYFNWSGNVDQPTALTQTAELSNGLQAAAKESSGIPLAITIDQEGGRVARITGTATDFPGNMALGATRNADLAQRQGTILGSELRALGINVDFAPDMDVNTNPANPVIGLRSMGSDPKLVADLGVAQIAGIQNAQVGASTKHFPGHGDTAVDSHLGLPVVKYDRATLNKHLIPFKAAVDSGVDMVMTAHIIAEAIDPDLPGTLSPKVLTGLLRNEMGFTGLVTTDALDMEGVQLAVMSAEQEQQYKHLKASGDEAKIKAFLAPIRAEVAVKAILAGTDILLNTYDAVAMRDGVIQAVRDGQISESRIDASVTRILRWKAKRHLTTDPVSIDAISTRVGTSANRTVAEQIANESITVLRNDKVALPLSGQRTVLVTGAESAEPLAVQQALAAGGVNAQVSPTANDPSDDDIARAVAAAKGVDRVVVTATSTATDGQRKLVSALKKAGATVIVLGAGLPYPLPQYVDADALVAAYGNKRANLDAAVRVLLGRCPTGKLPVTIPAANGAAGLPYGTGLTWCSGEVPTPTPTATPPPTAKPTPTPPEPPRLPPKTGH